MSNSTILRLKSQSFTPPRPFALPESKVARRAPADPIAIPPVEFDDTEHEQPFIKPAAIPETTPEAEKPVKPVIDSPAEGEVEAEIEAEIGEEPDPVLDDARDTPPVLADTLVAESEPKFSLKKRIAFLLAAIAVPALATPSEFGALPGPAPTEAEILAPQNPGMPFEQAGMSFPGSAFFYVDTGSEDELVALPTADPFNSGGEFGRDIGSLIDAGPAAAAFYVAGSATSQARAQTCLAQAVWYEAGPESEAGQRAIAQVVLNRVAHPRWPASVCGVVYEGSQRSSGCEFGFTCNGNLARKPAGESWTRAQGIARQALDGKTFAPIGLATHYHTRWLTPYWTSSLKPIGSIGAHQFYRLKGATGEKNAFTGTYSGIEPAVGGRVPRAPAASPVNGGSPGYVPPPAPRRASRPSRTAAPAAAQAPAPETGTAPAAPAIAAPPLRRAGDVKPEYSNAGQWKKKPAGAAAQSPSEDR